MKVHLIQDAIHSFLERQSGADAPDWRYPHSMIQTFQKQWEDPPGDTLATVYDLCLKSTYTQRWWKREHYRPKEIMLQLIGANTELAIVAWKDLFNEDADLEGRLGRFSFYCDELLKILRAGNVRTVEAHHHQDAAIVSLYLAGRYPDQYTLYPGLSVFQQFCKAIGSPEIPPVDDLVRYRKVAKVVHTFLQKDERYNRVVDLREHTRQDVTLYPFQMSYEVITFEAERFKQKQP